MDYRLRNVRFGLRIFLFMSLVIIVLTTGCISYGHSGRTDSYGGHRDNNNSSGLGSYHYHHGYSPHLHDGGECPYYFEFEDKNIYTYEDEDEDGDGDEDGYAENKWYGSDEFWKEQIAIAEEKDREREEWLRLQSDARELEARLSHMRDARNLLTIIGVIVMGVGIVFGFIAINRRD